MSAENIDQLAAEAAALDAKALPPPLDDSTAGQEQEQAAAVSTADMLLPIISVTFDMLCPAWKVTADEKKALAEAYAGVLDKYFPDGLPLGVEINALLISVMVFGPRMGKPPRHIDAESTRVPDEKPAENAGQQ